MKKKYVVVAALNPAELSNQVQNMMNSGWEPQGGVCTGDAIAHGKNQQGETVELRMTFFQAMIKVELIQRVHG